MFGETPPEFGECHGNTMVDEDYFPRGFCLAWFRHNGTVTIHAYFGEYLRTFPKDILRGMKPTMNELREMGVTDVYAVADERVPGSEQLVRWFRGVPTDQWVDGQGRYWRIDLTRSPI